MNYFRSETAIINNVSIGADSKIWHYSNLYGCIIGKRCVIGSYVEIQDDVKIGDDVIISSHSFICSLTEIEDKVFIGHGVVTINDLYPPSYRRTGSKSHWEKTYIESGVSIGSNVTLLPVRIGENAKIGAGSVVTKDIPKNSIAIGNPAQIIRKTK